MMKHPGILHGAGVGLGLLVACAVSEARADLHAFAGGGWTGPRGDSTAYVAKGLAAVGGLELEVSSNLGLMLAASYASFDAKASKLKADRGLPATDPLDGSTSIVGLTLAPKLYLVNHDIAAYFVLGGGPRWITHATTAAGTGLKSERKEQAWGVIGGFGVDVAFSEGFRIGFSPTYHRENADRRTIEYVTFVFSIKI